MEITSGNVGGFYAFVAYVAIVCIGCMVLCGIGIIRSAGIERKRILCTALAIVCPRIQVKNKVKLQVFTELKKILGSICQKWQVLFSFIQSLYQNRCSNAVFLFEIVK